MPSVCLPTMTPANEMAVTWSAARAARALRRLLPVARRLVTWGVDFSHPVASLRVALCSAEVDRAEHASGARMAGDVARAALKEFFGAPGLSTVIVMAYRTRDLTAEEIGAIDDARAVIGDPPLSVWLARKVTP